MTSTSPHPCGNSFLAHAPNACRRLAAIYPDAPLRGIAEAEQALAKVRWFNDADVATWLVEEPLHAIAALAALSDRPRSLVGERLAEIVPEVWGLTVPTEVTTYEHQKGDHGSDTPTPLLDGTLRALRYAIPLVKDVGRSCRALVTAVLLFGDVSKGGSPELRKTWFRRLGVDGAVHNEDSAEILGDVIRRILHKAQLSEDGRWGDRAKMLCSITGLVGMRLRGEVGRDVFADFHEFLGREGDGGQDVARAWSIINHCDTASVRDGLWTPELAKAFADEEDAILESEAGELGPTPLRERIVRIRHGAILDPARFPEVDNALDRLRGAKTPLEQRIARCRIWYAEAALGALSLDASIRLLAHLAGVAAGDDGLDVSRAWHLDLLGAVRPLRDDYGNPRQYPVRLLETLLDRTSSSALSAGQLGVADHDHALVSFSASKGGEEALVVEMQASEEAHALLTLLPIYERKEAAGFHNTLKSLCDIYGLRKDDFDRVANEASYLSTMNAGRSDKARMLEYVRPGLIVEVGPGGGVVLDLLSDKLSGSRLLGIDASQAVIEAHEARWGKQAPYEMVHGDAFELSEHVKDSTADTVILCSLLHEVYSYVPWSGDSTDKPERFSWGSVDALVQAAFKALKPGGRLIVRDGVKPADDMRVVEFHNPEWQKSLDLFAKGFEARAISIERLSTESPESKGAKGPRVKMSAPDLYEYLTTVTWGPAAFPYEVREQRALATRGDMLERLLVACRKTGAEAAEIEVPAGLASYLQPGYPEHIKPHVRIFDADGRKEVVMPDVTAVWVIEKVE